MREGGRERVSKRENSPLHNCMCDAHLYISCYMWFPATCTKIEVINACINIMPVRFGSHNFLSPLRHARLESGAVEVRGEVSCQLEKPGLRLPRRNGWRTEDKKS
jgi:hypothetical protein